MPRSAGAPEGICRLVPSVRGRRAGNFPVSDYTYRPDGAVTLVTNDGIRGTGRYSIAGRSVLYNMSSGVFAFALEHLDAHRMVLNIGAAGQRLACERR